MFRFVVLFFVAVGCVFANKLNIAVSDLEPRGIHPDEAAIISDRLREELLRTGQFRVMERGLMQTILQEQAFQQAGSCNSSECQVQIGRMLGVDRIVVGTAGKLGNMFTISVRMLNVETGEIQTSFSEDHHGAIEGVLATPVRNVALRLSGVSPQPAPTPPPVKTPAPAVVVPPKTTRTVTPAKKAPPPTKLNWRERSKYFGFYAAFGVTNLSGDKAPEEAEDGGAVQVGFAFMKNLGRFWALEIDGLLGIETYQYRYDQEFLTYYNTYSESVDETIVDLNVHFPVTMRLRTGPVGPFLAAGPQISVNLVNDNPLETDSLAMERSPLDIGMAIGAGMQFPRIALQARYYTSINENYKDVDIRHQYFVLALSGLF